MRASPVNKATGNRVVRTPRTDHARIDHIMPQIGLFRATRDIKPEDLPKFVATKTWGDTTLRVAAVTQCGAIDWKIFLAVVALCNIEGRKGAFNARSQGAQAILWQGLKCEQGLRVEHAVSTPIMHTSELLREAGMADNGRNRARLAESLLRLSEVTLTSFNGSKQTGGGKLISSYEIDGATGKMMIGITPALARTVMRLDPGHVRISLREVRDMTDPTAIILHGFLCERISFGDTAPARYHVDTLAVAAYGEAKGVNKCPKTLAEKKAHRDAPAKIRNRRQYVREAMVIIDNLDGWTAKEDHRGNFTIIRDRTPLNADDLLIDFEDDECQPMTTNAPPPLLVDDSATRQADWLLGAFTPEDQPAYD